MIHNLILDYNGTLNDDFDFAFNISMQVFAKYGLPQIPPEKARQEFVAPPEKYYTPYLGSISYSQFKSDFFAMYSQSQPPKLFPKVKETLLDLVHRDINLAILSSHDTNKIHSELSSYGINPDIFRSIDGNTENKIEKINEVLAKNHFLNEFTAYVGDTGHDIETAKSAHLTSIAATYGYTTKEKLEPFTPDFFINSFPEILTII